MNDKLRGYFAACVLLLAVESGDSNFKTGRLLLGSRFQFLQNLERYVSRTYNRTYMRSQHHCVQVTVTNKTFVLKY